MISAKTVQLVTLGVTGAASLTLIVLDILVATDRLKGNTISEITLTAAKEHPILPLAVGLVLGVLFGHLFWPQHR